MFRRAVAATSRPRGSVRFATAGGSGQGPNTDAVDWLQSLTDAARATGSLGDRFDPAFTGGLRSFSGRPVAFLERCHHDTVIERQVPASFVRGLVQWQPEWRGADWQKLVAITGSGGSGKTVMGMFGLADKEQLLVYVGTPPLLVDEKKHTAEASQAVQDLVTKARSSDSAGDKPQLLRDALGQHLLEKLTAIFGERPGVADPTDVIFFFDKLGEGGENNDNVRMGLRNLATALRVSTKPGAGEAFAFGQALETKLGLKARGFALGGLGVDLECCFGTLGTEDEYQQVTPNNSRPW